MNQLDENILLAGLAGHVKEVEKWHQMGGSLEVRNNSRDTLMHIAVSLNYTDLFDYVIDRVPRPFLDSLNREGLTPLMVACEKTGTEKMIEALLKRGVHRRKLTQDTKFTPLMTLAAAGRIEAIDLFYRYPDERAYPELDLPKEKRKGIRLNDIRALYPIMDRNHLMAATLAHQIEAMKFILKQEPALLNTQDRYGLSSLLLAARDGKKILNRNWFYWMPVPIRLSCRRPKMPNPLLSMFMRNVCVWKKGRFSLKKSKCGVKNILC